MKFSFFLLTMCFRDSFYYISLLFLVLQNSRSDYILRAVLRYSRIDHMIFASVNTFVMKRLFKINEKCSAISSRSTAFPL